MKIVFTLLSISILTAMMGLGCNPVTVMTAKTLNYGTVTQNDVNDFINKFNINKNLVYYYDKGFQDPGLFAISYAIFNNEGRYLDLNNNNKSCPSRDLLESEIRFILQNGDGKYTKDTIINEYYIVPDSSSAQFEEKIQNYERIQVDSMTLIKVSKFIPISLNKYSSQLKDENGNPINIDTNLNNFIAIKEFVIGGKPAYNALIIKDWTRDIHQIEKELNIKIKIVLVNLDIKK